MSGRTLRAFSDAEVVLVERGLRDLCMRLQHVPGGGKVEEDYWAKVYRSAKGIVGEDRWSNLSFKDFISGGVGVEWKLLKRASPLADQGRSLMHPAATRTIDYDPTKSAEECKRVILTQWARTIASFRDRVRSTSPGGTSADIRWGVLLWSPSLDEFLYFEEELVEPKASDFRAEWVEGNHRGHSTRNLHIFERASGAKRYSITLPKHGAKIQPYFDVPTEEQGAHVFRLPRATTKVLVLKETTYDAVIQAAESARLAPDDFVSELLGKYAVDVPAQRADSEGAKDVPKPEIGRD